MLSSLHLLILLILAAGAIAAASHTPYEILSSYDFPIGLLPKGAAGYEFDSNSGEFSIHFNSTCSFSLQNSSYQLRYEPTITGRISKDRLHDLKGVAVKVLLFWLNIVAVDRSGDSLQFSVGITSADFPVDNFVEAPECGCGMDCGGEKVGGELRGSF